ncbi:uncharacterized protein [Palaemon carinicauda]|uniref:uncharacterized protein n=1 Tax=Palaemon carinicauda TaxID=392227 RepID=UPI0035B683A7
MDDNIMKDDLVDLQTNDRIRMEFEKMQLDMFWFAQLQAFPQLARRALEVLVPFATTYLYWKIYIADLETVILRLHEAGLTAKPGKCFLGYEEIQYLGYVTNKRGIFPQQDKITAILDMSAPTTKKQL